MHRLTSRTVFLAAPLAAIQLVFAGASWVASAAAPTPPGDAKTVAKPRPHYVGVAECLRCHRQGEEQAGGAPIICTCKEADTWMCRDKHQDAFNALNVGTNPRAKQMADLLWPGAEAAKRDPQKRPECLSCHSIPGVNRKDEKAAAAGEPAYPKPDYTSNFRLEDGVGCIACHGAYYGSESGSWVDAHAGSDRDTYREQSRQEKEAKYGMTDLWNPSHRAEVCGGCHVGDRARDKVVTHEMYAAGHPPLPSFEIGCACKRLPRHWQLLSEKGEKARKLLLKDKAGREEYEETRLVVVGAAAALRQSMRLLAVEAEAAAKENGALDYAQMDCAACHHDLKVPSWRQERGYAGTPGRPGFRSWPLALIPVAVAVADAGGATPTFGPDFEAKTKRLYDAFGARPYGDPKQVADAANDLGEWAGRLTDRLDGDAIHYDRETALTALRRIARLPAEATPDYDAARQTAWAYRVVYGELLRRGPMAGGDDVKGRLEALDKMLELDLPTWDPKPWEFSLPGPGMGGDPRGEALKKCTEERRTAYSAFVPASLARSADYDEDGPKRFRQAFAGLAKLLP